jgi:hypothetical protein
VPTKQTNAAAPTVELWVPTPAPVPRALTQDESNSVADRIDAVIGERRRLGEERRRRARLNQLCAIKHSRERYGDWTESGWEPRIMGTDDEMWHRVFEKFSVRDYGDVRGMFQSALSDL